MGTQKNHLNETVLWGTHSIYCLPIMTAEEDKFCKYFSFIFLEYKAYSLELNGFIRQEQNLKMSSAENVWCGGI